MNILFLGTQMTIGGAQLTLLKLAVGFHQRGHQVAAMFLYDKDKLEESWQKSYPFPIINLGAWATHGGIERLWLLLRGLLKLHSYLRNQQVDILMSFTQHSNLLAIPLAYLNGIKGRVASNRGRIENIPLWMEWLHGKMINSPLATCLVVNSPLLIKQAVEIEKVNPKKIRLIYNGVAEEIIKADEYRQQREKTRKDLGIDETDRVLITVGRLTSQKGHKYLLQSMPAILACCTSTKLLVAGDGPLRNELEDLATQLDVKKDVVFLGTRTDIPDLLAAADIFILPSISEGMPNALLEAMAVGLPCVVSALEAVEGILQHEQHALLVPPADSRVIGEAVCKLLADEQLCRRLGSQAQALIHDQFSVQRMIEQYETLFRELLNKVG